MAGDKALLNQAGGNQLDFALAKAQSWEPYTEWVFPHCGTSDTTSHEDQWIPKNEPRTMWEEH